MLTVVPMYGYLGHHIFRLKRKFYVTWNKFKGYNRIGVLYPNKENKKIRILREFIEIGDNPSMKMRKTCKDLSKESLFFCSQ